MISPQEIAGTILAGGKASRMQYQDKALLSLQGKPLIEHIITRASPQVAELAISVNRSPEKYDYLNLPLIPDSVAAYAGPLVGIVSSMLWFQANRTQQNYQFLACFAGDVPSFPATLIRSLADSLEQQNKQVAVCNCDAQIQPLFSLWSFSSAPFLSAAIADGCYGPKLIMPKLDSIEVVIKKENVADFFNINSASELEAVRKIVEAVQ